MTLPRLLPCALALALALPAATQASLAPTSPVPHTEDSPDEGIHVSGEWTVTVREPDGTLIKHITFNNDLVNPGIVSSIFTSERSVGFFTIFLTAVTSTGTVEPCIDLRGDLSGCSIYPDGWLTNPQSGIFENLTTSIEDDDIVLEGSITIENNDSAIQFVRTAVYNCDASISPISCRAGDSSGFSDRLTEQYLDSTKQLTGLESGQIVSVRVVLGFN